MAVKVKKLKEMLKTLQEERKTIPQYTFFGEENWEDMDLEIGLLERAVKDPTAKNITLIIIECEDAIEELEENTDWDDEEEYGKMDRTRSMYNDLIDSLRSVM